MRLPLQGNVSMDPNQRSQTPIPGDSDSPSALPNTSSMQQESFQFQESDSDRMDTPTTLAASYHSRIRRPSVPSPHCLCLFIPLPTLLHMPIVLTGGKVQEIPHQVMCQIAESIRYIVKANHPCLHLNYFNRSSQTC